MIDCRPLIGCVLLSMLVVAVGCTPEANSSSSTSTPVSEAPATETSQLPPEQVLTVAQATILSEEIRTLRDRVELLEFELEKARDSQKQLYDDLDSRLRKFERDKLTATPAAAEQESTPQTETVDEQQPEHSEATDPSSSADSDEQSEQASEPVFDPNVVREAYDNAFRQLRQGKYEDSIAEFENIIATYPDSELVDDSWYWIAEANYVTQNYDVALPIFERMVRDYPDNQRASEAMLKIGYIHYDLQNYQDAQNYLLEVIDRYPASRSAFSARRRLDKMAREGVL